TVVSLKSFLSVGGWQLSLFCSVVALYVVFAACLLTAIMKLVSVVRPRSVDSSLRTSIFHFGHIAAMHVNDFRRRVLELDMQQTLDELLLHVHQSSRIADAKYKQLDKAVTWMFGGGLVGVAFALILLVAAGWM